MKMRRGAALGALVLSVVGMVAAYRLGRARADGVPMVTPLHYGGVLDDGGRPVEGTRNVIVRLWDAATAGATVCTSNAGATAFSGGRFRVALDATCVGAVRANPELWAELQVEGTVFPRAKLGAVPYALEAGRASAATGALEARLAAVEGRATGGRQVVIGSWRPPTPTVVRFPITCPTPAPAPTSFITVAGGPFSLTFVATATSLYRITSSADNTVGLGFMRIGVVPVVTPAFERVIDNDQIEAIFALTAGREYTFTAEIRADVGCRTSPNTEVNARMPIMAEQLD